MSARSAHPEDNEAQGAGVATPKVGDLVYCLDDAGNIAVSEALLIVDIVEDNAESWAMFEGRNTGWELSKCELVESAATADTPVRRRARGRPAMTNELTPTERAHLRRVKRQAEAAERDALLGAMTEAERALRLAIWRAHCGDLAPITPGELGRAPAW